MDRQAASSQQFHYPFGILSESEAVENLEKQFACSPAFYDNRNREAYKKVLLGMKLTSNLLTPEILFFFFLSGLEQGSHIRYNLNQLLV